MELQTERLLLREFVPEDWQATLAYQSDPRYLRFYPWTQRTERDVRGFVQRFLDHQVESPRRKFQLAMVPRGEQGLIGNCGLRVDDAEAGQANIGYELNPRCWGQGYATEAAREMLRFGFDELGLHRVWSWCIAENAASANVLRKLGMRQEGRLRENTRMHDRWWDTLLFAITAPEWRLPEPGPRHNAAATLEARPRLNLPLNAESEGKVDS